MIEHNYGSSAPYTVGVEEEFQLMRRETYDLVPRAAEMLGDATEADLVNIKPELMQSVIESATGVCGTVADAEAELRQLRRRLHQLADEHDCLLGSAGTHPFSRYEFQKVTEQQRYADIISRLKWVAQRELIFGLHVHVGIDSPDKAIAVMNHIRTYLPHILALSANSPFWQGRHTGLQSSRIKVFDSFPRSGVPERFASWDDWSALMERAMRTGMIEDYTYIWWDVRMHPRFGTIEVRVADGQTRVRDSAALAALVQGLAAWIGSRFDEGTLPEATHPRMLIDENKWQALRYGLEGEFIDLDTDERIPTRAAIERLLTSVEPHVRELGSAEYLDWLAGMAQENGASRQLECYERTESLVSVAEMLVEQTNDA